MLSDLSRRAFFRFELPIHHFSRPPRIDGDVSKWGKRHLVPPLVELEDCDAVADVYWGWDADGFYAAFDVPNRSSRPHCDPHTWWKGDGIRLCVDTRDARDLKRATRFCHLFYFLPVGGGRDGKQPIVGLHRMSRAKEPNPVGDLSAVRLAARVDRHGYTLEAAIPASCLHGWEPTEHPRIGVYYKIKDAQLGAQHLSVDDDFGWNADPSVWATGVLLR